MVTVQIQGSLVQFDLLWPIIRCEKHLKARDTDIILATLPKSGTTWLKALTFSIVNRSRYPLGENPLLTSNPHALIPFLERNIYRDSEKTLTWISFRIRELFRLTSIISCFRVLSQNLNAVSYIYIGTPWIYSFSLWDFKNLISTRGSMSLDEFLEAYCEGTHDYGPFWEHVLGYWNAHLENPDHVLFLKYEDLKKDINFNVKVIAGFIGYPFSLEEEKTGVIDKIVKLCSFDKLKSLEVNKVGSMDASLKNKYFFRKG
ncbi:cytosolic sulfotransferase 15-like [Dorcoceras hygrometricum]|uniref:Sulfotransferase n=1 Tax=Dorcoceras hygrometricum TaxID=472368 RepID=A0A2Z7CN38_9LAMI|nr:cytosolic sulfotransferase 15-like [Dorcoceras hygrometricum]KZV56983.1 cytosolic sulfotransferase 15-like [Dorcoceras hygrometricum]